MTFIALLLLAQVDFAPPPTETDWKAQRCESKGAVVTCPQLAFKALTDTIIEGQADIEKLQLQLSSKDAQLEALRAALLAVPPPAAPSSPKGPMMAVLGAVLGTMAFATALVNEDIPPGARIGLGITGAAAVAGSFVIIIF